MYVQLFWKIAPLSLTYIRNDSDSVHNTVETTGKAIRNKMFYIQDRSTEIEPKQAAVGCEQGFLLTQSSW